MNKKTNEEKINEYEEKIKQLEEKKKALVNRQKEKERKERAHRLIQNGALTEQYFDCEKISPSDLETLLKQIIEVPQVKNILTKPH